MAIKLPQRNYFTFPELMKRWDCEERDLFHLLLDEKLIPSYFLNDCFKCFDLAEYEQRTGFDPFDEEPWIPKRCLLHQFIYLVKPRQVSASELFFDVIASTRTCDRSSREPFDFKPTVLVDRHFLFDDVMREGVVMMSEVALFEGNAGKPDTPAIDDRPLSTTERNALLKLVIGMAVKGYGHDPVATKSYAPKEIADDLAALDISISDDTVRKYLKQAADAVLPAKQRQS
ncbi:MAG: hypothetical protein EPN61_11795 [Burkholderiaceae bacterium]|nr:MAG: hypothetical protein EPN61_11795 [Burkholderiaceae bacterium]